MTKLKAPEGATSAAVENDQYEVVDGHIEVENAEHIPHLLRHGFEELDGELSHSEPEPEERVQPDFSKFVNRQALVDYLAAHGDDSHTADEKRADLEAACVACFESGSERIQPEAQESEAEKEEREQSEQDELDKSEEE